MVLTAGLSTRKLEPHFESTDKTFKAPCNPRRNHGKKLQGARKLVLFLLTYKVNVRLLTFMTPRTAPRKGERSSSKKQALIDATLRLVAEKGVKGASIRSITRAAGVTEAAIYRHYPSKADLCLQIYTEIVSDMIQSKERIAATRISLREKLREWVRVTYEHFDQHGDAFTFVFLTTHNFPRKHRPLVHRQGEIFLKMIEDARAEGRLKNLPTKLAFSHFVGLLLSVPRLINEGVLEKPASDYAGEVLTAICRVFQIDK